MPAGYQTKAILFSEARGLRELIQPLRVIALSNMKQ